MIGLDTFRICAAALLASLCFSVVRRVNSGFDMPLRVTAAAVFSGMVLVISAPLFTYVKELAELSGIGEWQGILFGAFGIAFLSHITAEICRECGESSISGFVELVGKTEILILCLPLVKELLAEVEGLVG